MMTIGWGCGAHADRASGVDITLHNVANGDCVGSTGHHSVQHLGRLVGVPAGMALLGV